MGDIQDLKNKSNELEINIGHPNGYSVDELCNEMNLGYTKKKENAKKLAKISST